jgi:hypothetical protein
MSGVSLSERGGVDETWGVTASGRTYGGGGGYGNCGLCYERAVQSRITLCCRKVFCLEHIADVSPSLLSDPCLYPIASSFLPSFVSAMCLLPFTDPPIPYNLVAPLLILPTMPRLQIILHIHISPLHVRISTLPTLSTLTCHAQRWGTNLTKLGLLHLPAQKLWQLRRSRRSEEPVPVRACADEAAWCTWRCGARGGRGVPP